MNLPLRCAVSMAHDKTEALNSSPLQPYSGQSFHYTAYKNASASVTFNGQQTPCMLSVPIP